MARMLAFVNIFVDSPDMDDVIQTLSTLDNLELICEIAGGFDILTLVSASGVEELRDILKNKIMKMKGVKSVASSVVLKAHRGLISTDGGV